MFGARCTQRLTSSVTHLVTGQMDTQKVAEAIRKPGIKVVWRDWLKHSVDMWLRQPEEPYQIRPKSTSSPSKSEKTSFAESKTPPGSPPRSPVVDTDPSTPNTGSVIPVEGDFMLDSNELEDMDKEMEDLLADEDETGSEATDRDSDDTSVTESRPPTPSNRKRPRKSGLSEAVTIPDEGSERITKRIRRVRDTRDEVDTEFVDHEEHWREENYDEYPDEGNAPHLSDFDETDDEADEEEAAGTAIEAADMVNTELANAEAVSDAAMGGPGPTEDRLPAT
ncbi:hypothetical protein QFC24_006562 [Naganishia onofrii]|uniref:Uncharacterized protein n=1 Tax=Naganishia onofrii TaxID=1851511 RepID=A0ACC2X018_9TREE|nr:hypothetical protein QFC24_006562 [Naganishia onofrii]